MKGAVAALAAVAIADLTGAGCGSSPGGSKSARERAAPAAARSGAWVRSFRSRPDLQPPAVRVRHRSRGTARGLIFLGTILGPGQRGPVVVLVAPRRRGSYRAYRAAWTATPTEAPAVVVRGGRAYMSWNGATQVAEWDVLAGSGPASLRSVAVVRRRGFEASAPIPRGAHYVRVRVLNSSSQELRTSKMVTIG